MDTTYQPKFCYVLQYFSPTDPIRVFEMGMHKTPPKHAFGPAVRPYYLLHLVEKGKGYIKRDGPAKPLSTGDAFLIKPNEITLYYADEYEPWEYVWIAFEGDFAEELITRTNPNLFMKYQKSGLIALKNTINSEKFDALSCLSTLFDVLNSIKITPEKIDTDNVSSAALVYLEINYFRQMDVATLASQFGFSRAYFSSLFAKQTGETPYRYLTKIRMSKAKEFLKNTSRSIEEIAYAVGFTSLQRFSDMFKKYVGVSPLTFRKNSQKFPLS